MPTIEELDISNFDQLNIALRLELTADAQVGQATISVVNTENVNANDYVTLNPGQMNAEILQVQSVNVANQQITFTANLKLLHRNHEPAIKMVGNQLIVYRATNVDGTIPADSSFTTYGSPLAIDPTQIATTFTDSNGGNAYWYKFTYFNLYTNFQTDISWSTAVRGGGWGSYTSIQAIRTESGFERVKSVNDTDIAAKRAAAESIIDGALASAGYIMPLQDQHANPYVPEIVSWIDTLMSSGFVLSKSYGIAKPMSSKSGLDKVTQAEDLIARIQLNDIVLVDSNKQPLAKESLVFGFPGDNSEDPSTDVDPTVTTDDFAYPQALMNKKL